MACLLHLQRSICGALRAEPPVLARPSAAQGPASAAQKYRPSPQVTDGADGERDYIGIEASHPNQQNQLPTHSG